MNELEGDGPERPTEPVAERARLGSRAAIEADGQAFVGRRIGHYRIERLLGQGGMGTVFLGVRDDDFRQIVAIKLIRQGLVSEESLRRFRSERQVLAALNHPNIARLLDGGATAEGLPYLVMEHVEGAGIEAYATVRALGLEARLRLFRDVCGGVEHAHRNLIVHRDIKPSNVLVTADGVVKLIDFGLAKLLRELEPDETLALTGTAERRFTPAFASPEQFGGGAITTATDVYSLGVLLYRLLTGRHPYDLRGQDRETTAHIVLAAEPRPPSAVVLGPWTEGGQPGRSPGGDPHQLSARLRGDLDQIVLMALRKEPERRYPSVAALSEDLRRHAEGLPIAAREPTLGYRAGRFLRRHRLGTAAAGLVLLSLVGGAGLAAWQARRANAEARQAERSRVRAEKVGSFLSLLLGSADAYWNTAVRERGAGVTVAEVLGEAAARLEGESGLEPEVEASLRRTLGNSYRSLGAYPEAEHQLRRALALDLGAHGLDHPATAKSFHDLGEALYAAGWPGAALRHHRRSVAVYRRLPAVPPEERATALHDLAVAAGTQGRFEEAELLHRETIDLLARELGRPHPIAAGSLAELADLGASRGDPEAAVRMYRQSLAMFASLEQPDVPERGVHMTFFANFLGSRGHEAEAERILTEAIPILVRTMGQDHPFTANARAALGRLFYLRGEDGAAAAILRPTLEGLRAKVGDAHPNVALVKNNLAPVLLRLGRAAEAETMQREALAVWERLGAAGYSWRLGQARGTLGHALAIEGCLEEAEPLLVAGYQILETRFGTDDPRTQDAGTRLAELHPLLDRDRTGRARRP